MNCLHNYVVNDTPSFLSQPDRIETVFEMCKHVIVNDLGEDSEAHAVKLMEVIILQCQDNMTAVCKKIKSSKKKLSFEIFIGFTSNCSINSSTFST